MKNSRWSKWLPLLVLSVALIVLFNRLFLGEVIFWGLPSLQFYPWREFAMTEIAQGRVPLWNPYNGAGVPLLANYQSALLYPPHMLYFICSSPQMIGFIGILHILLAGVGMWLFAGRYTDNVLARGIAALAYPLSNTLISRFGTIPMLEVATWIPLLMLAIDLLIESPTVLRTLGVTVVTAMMMLAGHAQWTFYSMVLAGSYATWKLFVDRKFSLKTIMLAIVALVLAVGLAGAQIIPTAELQRQSQRASGINPDFAMNFSYSPFSLITFLYPDFFGNPGNGTYAVNGAYFEFAAYVGFLPLILALSGIWQALRRKRVDVTVIPEPQAKSLRSAQRFFALTGIVSLILALGKYGITPFLYRYVPTFNLFQAPSRWLLLTVFSLTMVAAFSVPNWKADRRTKHHAQLALVGSIILAIAGFAGRIMMANSAALTVQLMQGVMATGILSAGTSLCFVFQPTKETYRIRWMIAVLAFVAGDLVWANMFSNPTVPASFYDRQTIATSNNLRVFLPDPDSVQLPAQAFDGYLSLANYRIAVDKQADYRRSLLPNINLLDRQVEWNNFDPLRPEGFERYSLLLNNAIKNKVTNLSGLLRAAAIGQVEGIQSSTTSTRVWVVTDAITAKSLDEAEKLMQAENWDPEQTVILNDAPTVEARQNTKAGIASIVVETSQLLTISVESPDDGWLVVADSFYPGWKASVNSTDVSIYRANLAFRAVKVPAGKSTITMQYQPDSWRMGVLITAISLFIFVVTFTAALVQARIVLR